jgi:beta-1,4-mannosyl-glycoprotein beta-1,4-N-acetylglucosaminyltransferase
MRVFDCFPFFDELDILEIRLNELYGVVDRFIILESAETYAGQSKPLNLENNRARFEKFHDKILYIASAGLSPKCTDRTSGRLREADQRNQLLQGLNYFDARDADVVLLSDCDEIPRASSVVQAIQSGLGSVTRFKQRSYYYNVNTLVDYGHDFASRARIGLYRHIEQVGGMYNFRMANKNTDQWVVEEGGWHFGYFGDLDKIKRKVAALSPFLSEYKLFGDDTLRRDIREGRDLHHRRCELPETFTRQDSNDPMLPEYFLENRDRFTHFTLKGQLG